MRILAGVNASIKRGAEMVLYLMMIIASAYVETEIVHEEED